MNGKTRFNLEINEKSKKGNFIYSSGNNSHMPSWGAAMLDDTLMHTSLHRLLNLTSVYKNECFLLNIQSDKHE